MEGSRKKKMNEEDMGPETLPQDQQVGVSYIEFDDLQDNGVPDLNQLVFMATTGGSEEWKQHYDCLNIIRQLNKYHRATLFTPHTEGTLLSQIVAPFCAQQVENLRSNVSKCALMLVKEIFMLASQAQESDVNMQPFINIVLPNTLHKTVYEKQFIAKEAREACDYLAKGGANSHPVSIDCLVSGFKESKNLPLTEQAALFLPELVKKMPLEYFAVNSPSIKQLIQVAGTEALSKRLKVKKGALAILVEYKNRLTQIDASVDLMVALQSVGEFTQEKATAINREVEDSLKANTKKPVDKSKDFRSFLKQQKVPIPATDDAFMH